MDGLPSLGWQSGVVLAAECARFGKLNKVPEEPTKD